MTHAARPYDSGNQHHVDTRAKRARLAQDKADAEFAQMLEVAAFRAFVWGLLERTEVVDACANIVFVPDMADLQRQSGKREIGTTLLNAVLRADPVKIKTMAEEAAQRTEELGK